MSAFPTVLLEERNCVLFTFKHLELGLMQATQYVFREETQLKGKSDFTYKDEIEEIS